MSDPIVKSDLPTSFGTFKPVGHVMVGLPTLDALRAARAELRERGWPEDELVLFAPAESVEAMQALVDNASGLAGLGYEITMMRRYIELAQQGFRWLLVKVDDSEAAAEVAEVVKRHGATLAAHYRTLTVEELI
jgi:hypothetical protein